MPLNILATANNRFSLDRALPEAQAQLERALLSDSIRNKLARERKLRAGEPPTIVFTRTGAHLNLKLLLGVLRPALIFKATAVGACSLHANDFVESEDSTPLRSGLLPVVTEFAATWEIQNPRELAPLLRRTYYMYDRLLRNDPAIVALVESELGVAVADVQFAGLRFASYFPLLFGLYTVARDAVEKQITSIIDGNDVAAKAQVAPVEFVTFAASKARTLEEALQEFGPIESVEAFRERVEDIAWVSDALPFRKKPLLILPDGRYMVLDMQFLFENASAGLFWNFMDQFSSPNARHRFSGYWGGIFERYVQQLIENYHPEQYTNNASFDGGEIDVVVDLSSEALAIEVKSGFIAQEIKGARSQPLLAAELKKKYVADQDGKAKGVRQLAAATLALREQRVHKVTTKFERIYPILVVEDPVMQTIGMNAYLNELFEAEVERGGDIAPLTILLVDELEEILPHIEAGDFSWPDLLDERVIGNKVVAPPMHTTFLKLANARNLKVRADRFLESFGDELIAMITAAYRF
jgi:predicted RecB family endonuclease